MSADCEVSNPSFVCYEINGTQFIVQPLGNGPETVVRLAETAGDEEAEEEEEEIDENGIRFDDRIIIDREDAQSVPLVCLDGQVYTVRNGELQSLNISQLEYETAMSSVDEKSEDSPKECNYEEEETDCMEITTYESETDASPEHYDENEESEILRNDDEELFVIAKDNINANDYLEVVTAFKCKICPYTTQDKAQLIKHFHNIHTNPVNKVQPNETESSEEVRLMYMCGECSNCFPSMEDCRKHMIEDHQLMDRGSEKSNKGGEIGKKQNMSNMKPNILGARQQKSPTIEENIGSSRSRNVQSTKSTNSTDSNDRNVKCTYRGCFYKFTTEITMQQHAVCHLDAPHQANVFKCNVCRDMKFPKWKPCSLHLWKKHQIDVDLYTCEICKVYKCTTLVKLSTHMRVHSEDREFECPDCGKYFKQSSQLRNHRVIHIDRKSSEIPRWYTSKTCDFCGKTYADSKCLKNHIQAVHSKLRPYVCNVCGHASARKAMLQMHLRQHTGDKPFNCEICDYKTGDHNSLRRHMMRHTGVRPYKCPHCPYSAIQSNSYKNHLRSKHPLLSGLFTCDLCPFKTVKNESYLQHVGDHQKGLIKAAAVPKKDGENFDVFPGNVAAAQLIYSCLGAFSKVGKTIEASLMSASTSADGTSQTITIQIPSKHLEGSLPMSESTTKNISSIEQEDDETMHCFLKIPREEEENIDTGGITIPAEPEEQCSTSIVVDP